MTKSYNIILDETLIGTSCLEKADAPMGVVFGRINFTDSKYGYDYLKEYCVKHDIELASDYPEDKLISTMNIPELKIIDESGIIN